VIDLGGYLIVGAGAAIATAVSTPVVAIREAGPAETVVDGLYFRILEDTALVIETVFREAGEGIRGHFFLLPDPQTLEATIKAAERAASPGGPG